MAIRIGKANRTTPEGWPFMQAKLDLWRAAGKPAQVEVFEGWEQFEGATVWGGRQRMAGEGGPAGEGAAGAVRSCLEDDLRYAQVVLGRPARMEVN